MTDVKILVCEGPCGNGSHIAYDRACVADYHSQAVPPLAQALVHTPHEGSESDYTCMGCGTRRRFGGNPRLGEMLWLSSGPEVETGVRRRQAS